jgi:hypothetical protein
MTSTKRIFIFATVVAFTSIGVLVTAQQRPNRVSDQQADVLVNRIAGRISVFRTSLGRAIDRNPINGSRAEDDINRSVDAFRQAADRLRNLVNDHRAGASDVEEVLTRATPVNRFMTSTPGLDATADRDWRSLRGDLDELARAYGVPWQWTTGPHAAPRLTDKQVGQLLTQTRKHADEFRKSLGRTLDRSPLDGSRGEDDINQLVKDFSGTTDHLNDHFDHHQVVTNDIEDALRRGADIDLFMQRHQLAAQTENDWLAVRRDLDALAQAYNLPWNWGAPGSTTGNWQPGIAQRLTGTYQLDDSRGDDPARVVEQATRALPSNERNGTYQRLISRLNAPETIAIDRNGQSVILASSRGPQVTFEADGQPRTEQGPGGRSVTTRATLSGDRLIVSSTGSGGNDYEVTFAPLDNGQTLSVTRRLYDDGLREPVTVQSFYRRASDAARWDIYGGSRGLPSPASPSDGSYDAVPDGTRLVATLDHALSTRTARVEDRFTLTTRSPSPYDGAVIEGTLSAVNASGRVSGQADMTLSFDRIRMRDGRTYPFAGVLAVVRTPDGETIRVDSATVQDKSQTGTTVQRGAIGAALGAVIGAIAGGGKGAAIGGAIGAGVGAGTVIVQGRDQLDLPWGTELTIVAGPKQSQHPSGGGQS